MGLWYSCVRAVASLTFRTLFSAKYEGREHVPQTGGLLVISNHLSFLDPPLVASAVKRETHPLARKTLFKSNGFGAFIRSLNSIPIDQDRPDMNGLRQVIKHLKEGNAVLLFPEGSRSMDGKLQPGQPGAGLVAVKAGVPILPVFLRGTFEALPRSEAGQKGRGLRLHPLSVTIGKPFSLESAPSKDKEYYQSVADLMMRKIAELE